MIEMSDRSDALYFRFAGEACPVEHGEAFAVVWVEVGAGRLSSSQRPRQTTRPVVALSPTRTLVLLNWLRRHPAYYPALKAMSVL